MPCANYCSKQFIRICKRAKWNVHQIWILMEQTGGPLSMPCHQLAWWWQLTLTGMHSYIFLNLTIIAIIAYKKFWSNIIIQDGWQEAKRMLSTWRSKAWCNTFQELCIQIQIQILYCINSHPPRREVYFDSWNFVVLYCGLMQVKFTHILQGCFTDTGAIIPFFSKQPWTTLVNWSYAICSGAHFTLWFLHHNQKLFQV